MAENKPRQKRRQQKIAGGSARGARRTRLTVLQLALMGKGPIMRAEKELSKASSKTKR